MKYFVHTVIAIVTAALVTGVVIVGSPTNKRMQRFDEQRVGDLQGIQWQVLTYWQGKRTVPDNLDALRDDLSGYRVPQDPQTSAPYEYQKIGDLSFKLCATFVDKTRENEALYPPVAVPTKEGLAGSWAHGAGYTCFERTIDPDLYKPGPLMR